MGIIDDDDEDLFEDEDTGFYFIECDNMKDFDDVEI